MSNNWSNTAWESILPYFAKIKELPFIKEIMHGTLKQEQFINYISQDSIYLGEYGRVLAGIGAKLSQANFRESFLKFASDTVFVEQELHRSFDITLKGKPKQVASPTCLLYTSFLHRQLSMGSVEVAVAAILPCFIVYKKIGDFILENHQSQNNPYQKWINTYGGEDFAQAVAQAESIANALAEKASPEIREKMVDVYISATKMEWMFWNSAYKMEEWPL